MEMFLEWWRLPGDIIAKLNQLDVIINIFYEVPLVMYHGTMYFSPSQTIVVTVEEKRLIIYQMKYDKGFFLRTLYFYFEI